MSRRQQGEKGQDVFLEGIRVWFDRLGIPLSAGLRNCLVSGHLFEYRYLLLILAR